MSTTTITRPQLDAIDGDEDEPEHVFCDCDPDMTLCGLRIPDSDDWDVCPEDCGHPTCELCENVRDLPCTNPKCPDRARWWQVWR